MSEGAPQVIKLYAAREPIHPREISGRFTRLRWLCLILTQLVFYGFPWLTWNDRQAVLFDLVARKFYIFGLVLWPQDFIYLAVLLIICAYGLFLVTAVAGRVWCGFACPQTVYTEIFLWVERRFEGPRSARIALDRSPWNLNKILRRGGKHLVWIALGLWTGFTFVGFFTPIHVLGAEVFNGSLGPWETWWVLFYSFATYGNAGWMREQVCKYMCPYARFQSSMFDKDTLLITYDEQRGEQRGPLRKGEKPAGQGDCIDCSMCVQVCPTGIDIRNGLQYECIGCAACVDACNSVMDKVGFARGLVRYATDNGMKQRWSDRQMLKRALRPRVLIYSAVLGLIIVAFFTSLALRKPLKLDVIRDRGSMGRVVEDDKVENVYRLQIMNTSERPLKLRIAASGLPGLELATPAQVELDPTETRAVPLRLRAAHGVGKTGSNKILISLSSTDIQIEEAAVFIVPR